MFEDPELPDFDSMSQEELLEWLEQLAKSHAAASSEFIDDYSGEPVENADDGADEDDDWSDWLDDTSPGAGAFATGDGFLAGAQRDFTDGDPPVDLSLFADEDTAPTASLDWLDEIIAQQNAEALPDAQNSKDLAKSRGNPHIPPGGADEDDPLDWLGALDAGRMVEVNAGQAGGEVDVPDDFDETWEDDEALDDLEDESLFSPTAVGASRILESLPDLEDQEAEEQSTQSMAPALDTPPADAPTTIEPVSPPSTAGADSLSRAFLIQEGEADLEAWYADRLRAITAHESSADQPAPITPGKPPPPGLKAAIFSARNKVKSENLADALLDYETLLGTTAGLQWVVHDMRELIAQAQYSGNPAAHRVLGDALMRQGHLDAALNVYRHALTLL